MWVQALDLVGVQRAYDEFAESGIRTSQSALSCARTND